MFSASILLFNDFSSAIVPTEYIVAAAYLDGYDGNGYADYVTDNLDYGSRADWLTRLAEDYRRYVLATVHPSDFVLQRSESKEYGWLCTYAPRGIVMQWQEARLNDGQKVTFLEDVSEPDADEIAGIMSAMGDWLMHHAKWLVITLPHTASLIGHAVRRIRHEKNAHSRRSRLTSPRQARRSPLPRSRKQSRCRLRPAHCRQPQPDGLAHPNSSFSTGGNTAAPCRRRPNGTTPSPALTSPPTSVDISTRLPPPPSAAAIGKQRAKSGIPESYRR